MNVRPGPNPYWQRTIAEAEHDLELALAMRKFGDEVIEQFLGQTNHWCWTLGVQHANNKARLEADPEFLASFDKLLTEIQASTLSDFSENITALYIETWGMVERAAREALGKADG